MTRATHTSTSNSYSTRSIGCENPGIRAEVEVAVSATRYKVIRDRIRKLDPTLDEQTLADTVEGLTDVHEILEAVIRAALADEALLAGLKGRIAEMEDRRERLAERASKRRQIAKEAMTDLDIKKLEAPDFTASVRPGLPSLLVLNESDIPSVYWEPRDPRLDRQTLIADLKNGREVEGASLSNGEPILSVRTR